MRKHTWWVIALVVVVVIAILLWPRSAANRPTTPAAIGDGAAQVGGPANTVGGAVVTGAAGASQAGSASESSRPAPHAIRRIGAQTPLPTPQVLAGDAGVIDARPRPTLSAVQELTDRRGLPPSEAATLMKQQIMAGLELVHDDVDECLRAWSAADPSIEGDVDFGFDLDPNGLTKVWVQDYTDIPPGPLSCFSSAVYGVDWSGMADKPIEITYSFGYHPEDAGGDAGVAPTDAAR